MNFLGWSIRVEDKDATRHAHDELLVQFVEFF